MEEKITKKKHTERVMELVKNNHIWINAFDCISPSDETKKRIGEMILNMLNKQGNLYYGEGITSDNKDIRELTKLTPELFLSINKS